MLSTRQTLEIPEALIQLASVPLIVRGTTSNVLARLETYRRAKSTPKPFVYSPLLTSRLQYRYVNMDYFILSSLRGQELVTPIISYDIVCQWHKNFRARMETYPHSLQLNRDNELVIVYLVPKFHLPAHIEECQTAFSFNFTKGAARTDGEAPERAWADSNRLAPSTKEMGLGSRRDTLDDHWGDWNYKKVIGLGTLFLTCELRSTDIKG
jgi:hypothetical protein